MSGPNLTIPELADCYRISAKDYARTCALYGDAFQKDPIWSQILKDAPEKFPTVFGVPVIYTLKYGKIFSPSPEIQAAAAWIATPYVDMTLWRLISSRSLGIAFQLGGAIGKKIAQVFAIIEKDRKNLMTRIKLPFVYLFVLGVAPAAQGQGLGTHLVRSMLEQLPARIPVYLETETEQNVRFYERLGFEVAKEIQVPILDLPMWEMVNLRK